MTTRYGGPHQRTRAALTPTINAGDGYCTELICLMPTRWIQPGTPWDLAHTRPGPGYLGPAHASCNRAEGARHKNGTRLIAPLVASRNW